MRRLIGDDVVPRKRVRSPRSLWASWSKIAPFSVFALPSLNCGGKQSMDVDLEIPPVIQHKPITSAIQWAHTKTFAVCLYHVIIVSHLQRTTLSSLACRNTALWLDQVYLVSWSFYTRFANLIGNFWLTEDETKNCSRSCCFFWHRMNTGPTLYIFVCRYNVRISIFREVWLEIGRTKVVREFESVSLSSCFSTHVIPKQREMWSKFHFIHLGLLKGNSVPIFVKNLYLNSCYY